MTYLFLIENELIAVKSAVSKKYVAEAVAEACTVYDEATAGDFSNAHCPPEVFEQIDRVQFICKELECSYIVDSVSIMEYMTEDEARDGLIY